MEGSENPKGFMLFELPGCVGKLQPTTLPFVTEIM